MGNLFLVWGPVGVCHTLGQRVSQEKLCISYDVFMAVGVKIAFILVVTPWSPAFRRNVATQFLP